MTDALTADRTININNNIAMMDKFTSSHVAFASHTKCRFYTSRVLFLVVICEWNSIISFFVMNFCNNVWVTRNITHAI